VALAAILAGLKTTLERTSQGKVSEQRLVARRDLTPQSSDWSLWQELNRFRSENEQLKGALQQCEQSNGQLRDWIETITPFMHRMQIKFILQAMQRNGHKLHERQPPNVAAMEKWVSLTSAFIRKYLGDETASFFLVQDGDSSFAGRLRRLQQVLDKPVDHAGELQSDFDLDEAMNYFPSEK
jgi:hypothetical protein